MEIKEAVFYIDDSKSPGPDGFSAKFYKVHWEEQKDLLFSAVIRAFQTDKFAYRLNHNFITHVPFLIAKNHSAFVPERNIGENILLAHEHVRAFKKRGKAKM